MSKADNGTEYVFISGGKEHYEIVFEAKDVWDFTRMHNAGLSMPLKRWEETKKRLTEGAYVLGDQPFTCPRCGARTETQEDGRERCPNDGLQFNTVEF